MLFKFRKANSDDEVDDNGDYVIRPKVGRAEKVAVFVRDSDPRRLKIEKAKRSNRRYVPSKPHSYIKF